jgi:hypothetical protein
MTPTVRAPGQRHRDQQAAHRVGPVEVAGELLVAVAATSARSSWPTAAVAVAAEQVTPMSSAPRPSTAPVERSRLPTERERRRR